MKIKLDIISIRGYIYPVIEIIRLGEKTMYKLGQEIDIKAWRRERAIENMMTRAFLFFLSMTFISIYWIIVEGSLLSILGFAGFGLASAILSELI